MTREECLLLGTISKTHGVRGELIIRIADQSFEPDENWESIFLQIDGILVPFFISSLHAPRTDEWFILFDDYDNKDSAQNLVGLPVWIHKDQLAAPAEEVFLEELTGYLLVDIRTGKEGLITDFKDIPGNPVFEISMDGEKILVPARDELIEEIDVSRQRLIMSLPAGLL